MRPSDRAERAEQDVRVVHERPARADDDREAGEDEDREVHLQVAEQPAADREHEPGDEREPGGGVDDAVGDAERAQRAARGRGSTSETPKPSVIASFAPTPDATSSAPRTSPRAEHQRGVGACPCRWIRQVADRGDDVHAAHAPGREDDHGERQQHADRVGDDDARRLDRVADVTSLASLKALAIASTITYATATPSSAPTAAASRS